MTTTASARFQTTSCRHRRASWSRRSSTADLRTASSTLKSIAAHPSQMPPTIPADLGFRSLCAILRTWSVGLRS
jgi:hypothetical protein